MTLDPNTITQDDLLATVRDQQRTINRLTKRVNVLQKISDKSWPELKEYIELQEQNWQQTIKNQTAHDNHFGVIYAHLGIDVSDAREDDPILWTETARRLAELRKPWHIRAIARLRRIRERLIGGMA